MKKTITLDASQLAQFGKCPRAWQYKYSEGLALPAGTERGESKRDLGTAMHAMLDMYYTLQLSGPLPHESLNDAVEACWEWYERTIQKTFCFDQKEHLKVKRLFGLYVFKYHGSDVTPDTDGLEKYFEKTLYENEFVKYVVNGRVDFVGSWNARRLFMDHKTRGTKRDLHDKTVQMRCYSWALGIDWAAYNYIGTSDAAAKEGPFNRQLFRINDHQRQDFVTYACNIFDKVAFGGNQEKNLAECSGAYGSTPCMFNVLCNESSPEMLETLKTNAFVRRFWSPKQ